MYLFFNELSQLMTPGTSVSMTVHSQNGKLTVSILPRLNGLKDDAQKHLQPIVLTGTPEELDTGFFDTVCQPIQKAAGLLTGMKRFEESFARTESERKEEQERRKNGDKQAQKNKVKYEDFITRAVTQENGGNYDNALYLLQEARKIAGGEDIAKTDTLIEQLKAKTSQSSLF